jgi:hypothetical protein
VSGPPVRLPGRQPPSAAPLRLGEGETERHVRLSVSVVVYVDPVNGVGVEVGRLGKRVAIEDQHGPRGVGGRLEGEEVGEVESLVPKRRTEPQASKVI